VDLATFEQLLSGLGQGALSAAAALQPTEATFVACLKRLERQFDRELARAALTTLMLRAKARVKFSRAEVMYFTREALEQSSGEVVAAHRARRFAEFDRVGDYCCGVGGDTIELARRGPVVAIDIDPLRLAMARANVAACAPGKTVDFRLGDLRTMPLPDVPAAFFDPDRRAGGRRHVALRDYAPPPGEIIARLPRTFALGMKVAPAVSWAELHGYDAEAEFLSLAGELKECVLWFGPLRTQRRRATVLPSGESLAADEPAASRLGPVSEFLFDPDPAVTRAGLVADLGQMFDAHQLDADLAFLSGERPVTSPFARAYRVEASLPFHAGRLRELLRERCVGRVDINKRGSAVDADNLRKQLKLHGEEHRTVFLTRVAGEPFALVGVPVTQPVT
jgi:SAM-dependent methyltransferase